jgi:hypothetical protein
LSKVQCSPRQLGYALLGLLGALSSVALRLLTRPASAHDRHPAALRTPTLPTELCLNYCTNPTAAFISITLSQIDP